MKCTANDLLTQAWLKEGIRIEVREKDYRDVSSFSLSFFSPLLDGHLRSAQGEILKSDQMNVCALGSYLNICKGK